MSQTSNLRDAWSRLIAGHSFVLACHERPDGDCLGASLALARALRALGKEVVVLSKDGVPENYQFLPDSGTVLSSTDRRDFDVGVLVDADVPKRVGDAAQIITSARILARIDHHASTENFGEVSITDTAVSSTCELVMRIFSANDVPIDADTASLLLTGIIFDTGGFRYPNTSSATFAAAAGLVDRGANSAAITREVLENRPPRALRLLGRALASIELDEAGVLAWGQITAQDYADVGATDADTEGIVNVMSGIRGPKVVMLFREKNPGEIYVSLRSRDGVDVNQVARVFDGGGHAAAAGCTVKAPWKRSRHE